MPLLIATCQKIVIVEEERPVAVVEPVVGIEVPVAEVLVKTAVVLVDPGMNDHLELHRDGFARAADLRNDAAIAARRARLDLDVCVIHLLEAGRHERGRVGAPTQGTHGESPFSVTARHPGLPLKVPLTIQDKMFSGL